uniref:Biotin carboxyl carrier protein of acetyl-CoA carboxylase n=1 Tax=Apoglossum ruscifolium TaxID=167976 RepID=A0A4D6WQW2_9FLOR|nr:acetyl-CoA carboxylase, biotin carboxyl carrier protein [Apoglossum ruscifolium]
MPLKLPNLKKFIYSLKEKKFDQMNLQNDQLKIIVNKNRIIEESKYINKLTHQNFRQIKDINNTNYQYKNELKEQNRKDKAIIKKHESETYSTIISPMVGTFYKSSAPNEPAFIEKNNIVQKKQTVCIIEAMKLMNEIESEVYGEIIEILVNDGDIVDCGQALIKVKILTD